MADQLGSNLLLSMGLDLSPVKAAAETIKTTLNNLNELSQVVAASARGAAAAQGAEMSQVAAKAAEAVAAAKAAIAAENDKAVAAKMVSGEFKTQAEAQAAVTAATQAGIVAAQERRAVAQAELETLKLQTAELRKQVLEQRLASSRAAEGGGGEVIVRRKGEEGGKEGGKKELSGFGRLIQGATTGVLGEGILSDIAGGVLAGTALIAVIEGLGGAVESFIDKLKKVSIEEGNIVELQKVFNGLSMAVGVNAKGAMDKLNDASEGLVNKITLLRVATMALRSPYKISMDQTQQLAHDVTVLAEASGHTAEEGMQALYSSLARGRPYMLGAVTGVAGLRDVLRDIPTSLGPAQRGMEEWRRSMRMLHDQAEAIGDLPDTFEKMTTRMKIAGHNAMLEFGQQFNTAFAEGGSMQAGMVRTEELFKKMQADAGRLGSAVGDALSRVGYALQAVDEFLTLFESELKILAGIGVAYTIDRMSVALLKMTANALLAKDAVTGLTGATKLFRGALLGLIEVLGAGLIYFSDRFWSDYTKSMSHSLGVTVTKMDTVRAALARLRDAFVDDGKIIFDSMTGNWTAFTRDLQKAISDSRKNLDDYVAEIAKARNQSERLQTILNPSFLNMGHVFKTPAEAEAALAARQGIINIPDSELPNPSLQEQVRQAQAESQAKMAAAKARLQQKKDEIAAEKELDSEKFQYENESLTQHYANLRDIAKKSYVAAREDAAEDYVAQIGAAKARYTTGEDSAKTYRESLKKLQIEYNTQMEKADSDHKLALMKIDDEANKDRQEAAIRHAETVAAQMQSAVQRAALTTKDIRMGGATPDEYLASQVDTIRQTAEIEMNLAQQKYANSRQNQTDLETRAQAIAKAIDIAQQKLDDLEQNAAQVRMQAVQWAFQPQQQAIQQQISGLRPGENPAQLQQAMLDNLKQQRYALEQAIQAAQPYSDIWNQIFSEIEKTYAAQQKYNDELRKSNDLMQPLAQGLGSVTHLMTSVWTSRFVQGLSAGMQGGLNAVKQAGEAGNTIRNAMTGHKQEVPKDPQMLALEQAADSAANTFGRMRNETDTTTGIMGAFAKMVEAARAALSDWIDSLTTKGASSPLDVLHAAERAGASGAAPAVVVAGADLGGGTLSDLLPAMPRHMEKVSSTTKSRDDKITNFTTALTAAVGELSNFADALSKSTSAVGGAIAGGTAGAGFGQMVSSALGKSGPWGMLAGAGVGMLGGLITGEKNAQISSEMSMLNVQYTSLMDSFHSNTNNLNEAIVQMQELIAEAQVDAANSKKGGRQFASLISQYSQQLIQLKDQQKSVVSEMEVQLGIFSAPTGMQQFLTNLQSIIEQYDKFYGAAQNAKELAQANSFLTDSLSSYTNQMENTFVQDEEHGIQDALNLNSLLSERSTLITQLNNSIMNVLEQGVLTRQQTFAQTKGHKIYELESQASLQLTSINQEISLEQYKVAVETSLYNLAMTSMGLEAQLLALQEGQASQSLAAISALQQLIQMLQGGSYNFTTISSILAGLGFGGAAGNIPGSGLTNPGSNPASTNAADALIAAAYQSRATLGYAAFRGQTL